MEFAKGLATSAAKAASAAADAAPRSARSKFRARGQTAKETAMEEPESNPIELLVQRPAINSSSHANSVPPARRPAPSKPAAALIDSLPIRLPEDERIKRYMEALHGHGHVGDHNAGCASCLGAATPAVSLLVWVLVKVAPLYLWLFRKACWFYSWAPTNLLQMCFGVGLAFFGGTYVAAIAAVEAFRLMGWQRTWADLKVIYAEMRLVYDRSEEDDLLDDDGSGILDVDELTPQELATRKLGLAMRTVKEPEKLQSAVGGLWSAYLAVLATLRLEFARVAALALGIAEMLKMRMLKWLAPPLCQAIGPELRHWVPTLISTAVNIVAVVAAWYLQQAVSAFYSALRGGKLFASALFTFLDERGWLARLPCVAKPFDPDDSHLDEALGYVLAAAGFVFQLQAGFALFFPLNIVLLPLTTVEWVLRWQIVMGTGAPSV